MLRIFGKSHICRKCRILSQASILRPLPPFPPFLSCTARFFATEPNEQNKQDQNSLENAILKSPPPPMDSPSLESSLTGSSLTGSSLSEENSTPIPIRKQLEHWVQEKKDDKIVKFLPADGNMFEAVTNRLSKPQSTKLHTIDDLKAGPVTADVGSAMESGSGNDEQAIVGTSNVKPGDLVEIETKGFRVPLMAIYLGFFGERHHLYVSNGYWNITRGFTSVFVVSNFVKPEELEPILAKLPADGTLQQFIQMKDQGLGPSRDDAKPLLDKMNEFSNEAETIYHKNLSNLDAALDFLSGNTKVRYMSLFEMAEMLLPPSLRIENQLPPPALYAVHTALIRNEYGFIPLSSSRALQRRDQIYEIFSQSQSALLERVSKFVRLSVQMMARGNPQMAEANLARSPLGPFIAAARKTVLNSRKVRDPTPHGILKPTNGTTIRKPPAATESWQDIISFLELWASYDLFTASPRLFSNGAMILRLLGLYDGFDLNQATAWTFLQEIGHIMPWEVPSRYKARFPSTRILPGAGLERRQPNMEESHRSDIAADARRRVDAPVFCIDAASTRVIDDGVSLERTGNEDEFWIHVHAADPASGIKPNSELCKYLELIPDNIYLPGHFQAMLPAELEIGGGGDYESKSLVKQYSLQKDCRALTFSAKVNRSGDVLDYKIEPSRLSNVVYLDPVDVAKFCGEPGEKTSYDSELTVGTRHNTPEYPLERSVVLAQDLGQEEKKDLLVMKELTAAIQAKRLQKGAWPYFFPRPSVSVEFDRREREAAEKEIVIPADPYIQVRMEPSNGCALVANSMVLAGEIAARWCADRKIAVPFRRDTLRGKKYEAALAYAQKELYPLIEKGVEPDVARRNVLAGLTGGIEVAAEPGPYFLLGLDMYAKTTSPLRRFGDLLAHWQIHSALAFERAEGRRLDGARDDVEGGRVLAFSAEEMAETLPMLHLRELLGRAVGRGTSDWIRMALVRAWLFEGTVPKRLTFTVDLRFGDGLKGRLDLFDLPAMMGVDGLKGRKLVKEVGFGEKFEVELVEVNVFSGKIRVQLLDS